MGDTRMRRGQIRFFDFGLNELKAEFGNRQSVLYLHEYLAELGAEGVIAEEHYVDRHYIDDFANYYALSFATPDAHCARFHFFRGHTRDALRSTLQNACDSAAAAKTAQQSLQDSYLGFVVRRPLAGASIGRTVLKTYPVEGRRHYEVLRPYEVHLAGLKLRIEGLAYQEQDQGAAVCASTALWSALQQVAHVAGNRTPTPSAITEAAASPFPAAAGLDLGQMAQALSRLGYVAEYFEPCNNRNLFRAQVVACLLSRLPIVLIVKRTEAKNSGFVESGHAVTVTGFSNPDRILKIQPPAASVEPIPMRSGSLSVIYVHDDNLGCHAHYELRDSAEKDELGNCKLVLHRGNKVRKRSWWQPDDWDVLGALVPKAPKMRLPVESLMWEVIGIQGLLSNHVFPHLPVHYSVRLDAGIRYRSDLWAMQLDPRSLYTFQTELSLPRHVGVVSVFHNDNRLLDALVDVSQVNREPLKPAILALIAPGVPARSVASKNLLQIGRTAGWQVITGP